MSVTAIPATGGAYRAAFEAAARAQRGPGWLGPARRAAFERFLELGFPTPKHEEWRHTNVAAIAHGEFTPAPPPDAAAEAAAEKFLAGSPFAALGGARLVFLDGRYAARFSTPGALGAGVRAGSLGAALAAGDGITEALTREAAWSELAFVALNTALFEDGAVIEIGRGQVLPEPVHVLYLATAAAAQYLQPRTLILAGRDSQASVIEAYASLGEQGVFTNAVTEIVAEENAALEHARLQQENLASLHVSTTFARAGRTARVALHALTFGGALTRNDVTAVLDGQGAEVLLNGLYIAGGRQHIDNHTVLDHAQPLGTSREYYKGILDGQASTAFRGRIVVRPDAQHTDAIQSDKNLLLSADAVASSDPQLEIRADDVRCTHGATFGQIDAEALFYLQSRGVGAEAARRLLTFAFASDVLARLRCAPLRRALERELFHRWTGLEGDGEA